MGRHTRKISSRVPFALLRPQLLPTERKGPSLRVLNIYWPLILGWSGGGGREDKNMEIKEKMIKSWIFPTLLIYWDMLSSPEDLSICANG